PPASIAAMPMTRNGKAERWRSPQHEAASWRASVMAWLLCCCLFVFVREAIKCHRCMGSGTAGAHFRSHPDRLHDFLPACAFACGGRRVSLDAVRRWSDGRHSHGNQLLGLGIECARLEHMAAEIAPRILDVRRVFAPRIAFVLLGHDGVSCMEKCSVAFYYVN